MGAEDMLADAMGRRRPPTPAENLAVAVMSGEPDAVKFMIAAGSTVRLDERYGEHLALAEFTWEGCPSNPHSGSELVAAFALYLLMFPHTVIYGFTHHISDKREYITVVHSKATA